MARTKTRKRQRGQDFDMPTVLSSQEVLDKAFHRATKVTVEDKSSLHRARRTAMAKVDSISSTIDAVLVRTIDGFAPIVDLHPFHRVALATRVDLGEAMGAIRTLIWCNNQIKDVCKKAVRQLDRTRSRDFVEMKRKEVYGRVSSLIERISPELQVLQKTRDVLKSLPHIDPKVPTAVIAGSPNVGKSALVARLSSAEPEVASYPFTTKAVTVGHFYYRGHAYQVVDTPGILDRPLEERNPIELRALAAIENLSHVLVFLIDPSESCGTSVDEQEALLVDVRSRYPEAEVLVVETKADLLRRDEPGRMSTSAHTGEGVEEPRDAHHQGHGVGYRSSIEVGPMVGSTRSCCSTELESYFQRLAIGLDECIDIARRARSQGFEPETEIEIPVATDLAERVENLVGPEGIAERIRNASEDLNREECALHIARDIVKTMPFPSKEKALDQAIRTGLAVLTEGVLVAPLEGVSEIKVKSNADGSQYADVYFSGPIRAAGGTAQALSVLIADVVRRELKLAPYQPTPKEVERYKEEIRLYKQVQHLQYLPSNDEIDLIASHCPVCINGDGTEDVEVSGNRDLERVETNRVRSGACLVMAEGMCLKAPKVQRHVSRLGVDGWDFISDLLASMHKLKDDGDSLTDEELEAASERDAKLDEEDEMLDLEGGELDPEVLRDMERQRTQIAANYKYMKELIAGRPVFAHPSRPGGFRLRYGRTRATGLAAIALSPATMMTLDRFVAIGTQLKIERPGKAGAITPCESIEGPIALLKNGDLVEIDTVALSKEYANAVDTIYDVGEVLIPYGEFLENNHNLVPGTFSEEWWREEVRASDPEASSQVIEDGTPTFEKAVEISRRMEVPLHPHYNLFWHDLTATDIMGLAELMEREGRLDGDRHLRIPVEAVDPETKDLICSLGALHTVRDGDLIFERFGGPMVLCLGLEPDGNGGLVRRREVRADRFDNPLSLVSYLAGVHVKARGPTRIGARMGRPEKAKERKMKPPPHILFPVGPVGGTQRLVNEAIRAGRIQIEMGHRKCPACGTRTPMSKCECGGHTLAIEEPSRQNVDMAQLMRVARSRLGDSAMPTVKGVKGMVSKIKVPEPLEKGILRAKHGVFVFKDGTVRYDMTDVPVTHFTPREVELNVEQARDLGYVIDVKGEPLKSEDQLLELHPQDIIPSKHAGDYLVRAARFIDDLLVKLYNLPAYYNAEERGDLIGHLTIGLAPHTSGGVLCRIIGYTGALGCYAHPFFHASKRRNCDGDEDCIMLLLDGLINFSRRFLPEGRGGLMDAPLVLSSRIDPNEIDKEAQNLDVLANYPLELYLAAEEGAHPKELEAVMDTVGGRIGTPEQYEEFSFTHDVLDINAGVRSILPYLGVQGPWQDDQEDGGTVRAGLQDPGGRHP
jgi:DNA polymerase II large subunit